MLIKQTARPEHGLLVVPISDVLSHVLSAGVCPLQASVCGPAAPCKSPPSLHAPTTTTTTMT